MKAEVTTENRPAWNPGQHVYIRATRETYEYQCRIQIIVVSLFELPVVLLRLLTVVFIKSRTKILRGRAHALPMTVR